jgi:AraC family transcriptional regulator
MSAPETEGRTHRALGSHAIAIAGVCHIELLPRAPYETTYIPDRPVIGFAFETQTGTHAFASSRKVAFHAKPYHLSFVPAGCDVYSQSKWGGEYLKITLERGFPAEKCSDQRFSNIVDARAIKAAHRLRRELIAGFSTEALTCEHLVGVLEDRVAGIQRGEHREGLEARWMTPRRLQLVDEIIEARLDGKLTVLELAAQLGLSTGFFSRAFKAAVGKPPHDYIIDRRVARARVLLQSEDRDLTAVALASGFASHAHMTVVFRARLGHPPSRLRSGESVSRRRTI